MARDKDLGRRLLVTLIDRYAVEEPLSVWGVIPLDEQVLSEGFRDITYGNFANAINIAASWLQERLPPPTCDFQTIAYVGPKDVRYPIIAVAAAKLQRKVGLHYVYIHIYNTKSSSYSCHHRSLLVVPKRISLEPPSAKSIYMEDHSAPTSSRYYRQTGRSNSCRYLHFPTFYGNPLHQAFRTT